MNEDPVHVVDTSTKGVRVDVSTSQGYGMFANRDSRVVITGGSRGIGFALAQRFLASGATVLVTGRDAGKMDAVQADHPSLLTFIGDVGVPGDRERLAAFIQREMPDVDVVINNAGIQRRIAMAQDHAPWAERQQEIDILLAAPIHLASMLVPIMLENRRPGVLINVTSGGAYIPQPFAPTYAACKAALHSYTVALRDALSGTPIRVVELIPPAVATGLAGPGDNHGVPLDEFVDSIFPRITGGSETDVGFGMTSTDAFAKASEPYQAMFETLAGRFPVRRYGDA